MDGPLSYHYLRPDSFRLLYVLTALITTTHLVFC